MFVSTAFAQTAGGASGGMDIMGMLPLVLLFVLLYFLMIRPQAKKQKEHKTMLEALQKGDEVVAGGGVFFFSVVFFWHEEWCCLSRCLSLLRSQFCPLF